MRSQAGVVVWLTRQGWIGLPIQPTSKFRYRSGWAWDYEPPRQASHRRLKVLSFVGDQDESVSSRFGREKLCVALDEMCEMMNYLSKALN
jgi:hypothetical protein